MDREGETAGAVTVDNYFKRKYSIIITIFSLDKERYGEGEKEKRL